MTTFPLFRALIVAFVMMTFAPPAPAAPVISQGAWYESINRDCANVSACTLTFTPVGTGKTLIARNVTCRLITPNNARTTLYVWGNSSGTTQIALGAPQIVYSTNRRYYVNAEILMPFVGGNRARIVVNTEVLGNVGLYCSLSGELKP